jgi:hypothetical protein
MQLVWSRLPGEPSSLRSLIPTRRDAAENNKYVEEETARPSRFIGDSSPIGNVLQTLRGKGTPCEGASPLPALLVKEVKKR